MVNLSYKHYIAVLNLVFGEELERLNEFLHFAEAGEDV